MAQEETSSEGGIVAHYQSKGGANVQATGCIQGPAEQYLANDGAVCGRAGTRPLQRWQSGHIASLRATSAAPVSVTNITAGTILPFPPILPTGGLYPLCLSLSPRLGQCFLPHSALRQLRQPTVTQGQGQQQKIQY